MPCNVMSLEACLPIQHQFAQRNALSVKQPFASLIVYWLKTLEVRTRQISVRGRVVICSSLKPYEGKIYDPQTRSVRDAGEYLAELGNLALYGHAIGLVDIVGCRLMLPEDEEHAFVPFRQGAYVWEMAHSVEIEPFPVIGQQGFFKVPAEKIKFKVGLH